MQPKIKQLECFGSNFRHGIRAGTVVACKIKMMVPWVETYRLRGGDVIMSSLCNVTRGVKSDALVLSDAWINALPKQSYWVNLFHVSLVGRCTGDLIIVLKPGKVRLKSPLGF